MSHQCIGAPACDHSGRWSTASALAATITDPTLFRSGRHLAAWLGLVPRQHSTGGKAKLGRITKMGDQYLRTLLIVDMAAVIRSARRTKTPGFAWVNALLERRPARLVPVAVLSLTIPEQGTFRDGSSCQSK